MLSGHPFCGKSTLVCGLLGAIEGGEAFLGQSTRAATALLVNEEDEAPLRDRARLFGLFAIESEYVSRSESGRHEWPTLIAQATQHALAAGHGLLVIDTFPGLAGLGDEQENDSGAIAERLRPLQMAAAKGLCVLFLHHMNSQSQPRGSKAFRGIVDISIRLMSDGRNQAFRLETRSRFPTTASAMLRAELVRAPNRWTYRLLENGRSSPGQDRDSALWAALVEARNHGLTYDEIDRIEGLSKDIAKRRLPKWYPGRVDRRGAGTKTKPFRWYARTGAADSVRCAGA